MNDNAVIDKLYIGDKRATMKIPAVTIVAAWIKAEIGVGPSIESGSQTCNGNCADLPIAPTKSNRQITVIALQPVFKKVTPLISFNLANTSA